MAAAAIAAKAAINRKIAKQKKAALEAALAAGLDPEEEFMKHVMERMKAEKETKITKWQDPEQWSGCPQDYVKFANRMQHISESDSFNLFIIGVIIAAGIVVGFQTYAFNDRVYFCANAMPLRLQRCTDAAGRLDNKYFDKWCNQHNFNTSLPEEYPDIQSVSATICGQTKNIFGQAEVVLAPNYIIIETIDYIILGIFAIEVFIKIFAEGMAPWNYWFGGDWKWNNFDFIIVVLCLPVWGDSFGGSSVALLRLMRLMRVMKLVKKIPQLQMIVMGLIGGMQSISYILLLLTIVLYLFAIMGIYAFGLNDTFHFGNLNVAMFSLFRAATLEDWTDIMYINIFGCAGPEYDSGIYTYKELGREGVKWADGCPVMCDRNSPNPYISTIYWVGYIVISALVMLSLFIGAVTMSMTESMEEMKNEAKEVAQAKQIMKTRKKRKQTEEALKAADEVSGGKKLSPLRKSFSFKNGKKTDVRGVIKLHKVLLGAWDGSEILDILGIHDEHVRNVKLRCCPRYLWVKYWELSKVSERFAESSLFVNFITVVICIAGVMVGIQTEINENNNNYASCSSEGQCAQYTRQYEVEANASLLRREVAGGYSDTCLHWDTYITCPDGCYTKSFEIQILETMDTIILAIFCVEILVKVIGKFDRPWYFFHVPKRGVDRWNCFDFVVVAGSFLPGSGSLLTILRLLRLLRVLKLLKAFPALQVLVMALISGLGSIAYIGVILVLVFYIFGILAMILYSKNDPWHFGTVHISMLSLFRAATLEDWTDIMYTNVYGCANYGAFATCEDVSTGHRLKALRMDVGSFERDYYFNQANITAKCGVSFELGYTPYCCCAEHSAEGGIVAWVYFTIFCILGALVLMTLFIGVITTSMEEAQEKNDKERKDEETVKSIVQKAGWGPSMIQQYAIAFRMLDLDGSGTIDQDELRDGLEMIGRNVSEAQLKDMMAAAELDKEQGLEFPSFVRLFVNATSAKPTKDESAELLLDADQAENKTKRTSVADQELSQPVGLNDSKTADLEASVVLPLEIESDSNKTASSPYIVKGGMSNIGSELI